MTTDYFSFNPEYREEAPALTDIEAWTGYAILEFGASWCSHCQAAESVIKDVLLAHPKLPHVKIADGRGKKLGRVFKVKLWPTLILLKDGQEVSRLVRPTGITEVRDLLAGI